MFWTKNSDQVYQTPGNLSHCYFCLASQNAFLTWKANKGALPFSWVRCRIEDKLQAIMQTSTLVMRKKPKVFIKWTLEEFNWRHFDCLFVFVKYLLCPCLLCSHPNLAKPTKNVVSPPPIPFFKSKVLFTTKMQTFDILYWTANNNWKMWWFDLNPSFFNACNHGCGLILICIVEVL